MKGKTVIIKPVSIVCNQKCDYCYNLSVPFRTERAFPKMSLETVERLTTGLIELGMERIRLVWHGGEPLLAGMDFYKGVMLQQKQIRDMHPDLHLENGMQSNLTRLTPEWCAFFKEHGFALGTSLDGWAEIHNAHRKYPDGSATFDDVLRGIELAESYKILGGLIAVVNDVTLQQDPKEFFEYLVSVCPRAEITPCWETETDESAPIYAAEPEAFLEFTKEMFDAFWVKDDPKRQIRMFHGFLQALLGGKDFTCAFKGNCGDFLSVEADGSVYPCGKFSGIPEFKLGNVNEQTLGAILENPIYTAWLKQRSDLPEKCQNCRFQKACNNGCTYERYLGNEQFAELSPYCDVWFGLYEHIDARIQSLRAAQATKEKT